MHKTLRKSYINFVPDEHFAMEFRKSRKKTEKKLKILFIIGRLDTGGAARQFMELVQRISTRGIKPIVCTLEKNFEPYHHLIQNLDLTLYSYERTKALDWSLIQKLIRLIRKENIFLIQTWQPLAGFYGIMASTFCRVPTRTVCSTIRDAKPKISLKRRLSNSIQAKLSSSFISNTQIGLDTHFKKWKKNFNVIVNGIDLERFTNIDPSQVQEIRHRYNCENYTNIVMAANLRKSKDPFTLIKAAHMLLADQKKIQVFIIGEGELKQRAMQFAINLKIEDHIHFLGYQHNIEVHIAAFDIAVLLADMKTFQEGISNFLLESMALKKVVVATRGGGNIELIEHGKTGYLVNPYDPENISKTIIEIISKDQSRIIEDAYRHVVKTYDMEKYINNYFHVYQKLTKIE